MDDDHGKKSEDEMRSKLRIYLIGTCAFAVVSQLMLFCFNYRSNSKETNREGLIKAHADQDESRSS